MDRKMKDTRTESERQKAVKKLLKQLGFSVWSTSQGRKSAVTKGVPDLIFAGRGVCGFIEMKALTKQSPEQVAFMENVRGNGGTYLVVHNEGDIIEFVNTIAGNSGKD